ncbi:NLR family CARD domain-containing protein 4-like [Branchiostoma floridae x Branchiostoma belcheri]
MLDQLYKEDKEVKDILLAHGEILKRLEQRLSPSPAAGTSQLSGASSTQMDQKRPGSTEESISFHKRRRLDEFEAGSTQGAGPSHMLHNRDSEDEETDKKGDVLRSALSINYSNTLNTLKPLPWDDRFCLDLDRIFTNLVLVSLHDQTDRRILKSLEDVYDHQTVSDLDRRFNVLVEGHAGSGKSTLLSKTALDWSCKKGRLADMKKIVLLVRLREVQPGESIAEIVWDQCVTKSAKGISISAIETCLQDNESKLVFLLDGYDELVPNAKGPRQAVPELLAKRWYPNSTVIVTSRPLSGIDKYMAVGCKVEVAGFSSADVDGFTATYFQTIGRSDLADPLIEALKANIVARNLIQTPMFIMLVCVLWEDDPDRVFPGTMSGLYQELLTCVIRKHCVREGLSMSDDKIPCELSPILLNLGKLALESLLRGESLVDLGKAAALQDTDTLLKLGIVSKEVSASRLHPREQLNFPHKTMQEFLAGRYVAYTVNTYSGDLHELVPLDTVSRALQQSTLVHFICGCGGKATEEMLTKIYKLHEADVPSFNYTNDVPLQGWRRNPELLINPVRMQTISDSVKDLCMMNLYESQDCRYFSIVSNLLSSLDLTINVPSREGAALAYYLQHAAVVPEGRLLRLKVEEHSKGEAVEYLSGMLENSLPDLGLYLSFNESTIENCHIGDKFDKMVTFLQKVPGIRSLNLEGTGLTRSSLQALRQILPKLAMLEKLDLSDNPGICKDEITLLTGLVSNLKLTDLRLWGVGLGDVSLKSLVHVLHHLSHLEILDLSYNSVGKEGMEPFAAIQQPVRLKELYLQHNKIGDVCLKSLAGVMHHLSCLKHLDLSNNNVRDEGMEALSTTLHHAPCMEVLYLQDNPVTEVGIKGFVQTICIMPAQKKLKLGSTQTVNLDDTAVMSITSMLTRLPILECLHLLNISMSTVGLQALTAAMEEHTTVRTLGLAYP